MYASIRKFKMFVDQGGNGSIQVTERSPLIAKDSAIPELSKRVVEVGPIRVRVVFLIALFSFGVVFGRVATFASTPLWIDSIKSSELLSNASRNASLFSREDHEMKPFKYPVEKLSSSNTKLQFEFIASSDKNPSHLKNNSADESMFISPYYIVLAQQLTCTVVFGFALLAVLIIAPGKITARERNYPKWRFLAIGFGMALSSLLCNSATSGAKTAPYLQAILMNFNVPITFTTRFFILRKRPTPRKLLCACVVVVTEFVCMLPTIFPNLESNQARQTEGGGEGVGRIIWPLIFVLSQVPYAVQSTVIEKVTKDQSEKPYVDSTSEKSAPGISDQINMVYFLFWSSAFTFVSAVFFFWTQVIPDFADVTTFPELGKQLWFNARCQFGQSPCSSFVPIVSSFSIGANLLAVFSIANLLRWSEGANFMMVVSTIRTPSLFLFWTLFEEVPFRWYPHASLSTWLSIGAIFIMLPAVYAYSTGPPEHDSKRHKTELEVTTGDARAGKL